MFTTCAPMSWEHHTAYRPLMAYTEREIFTHYNIHRYSLYLPINHSLILCHLFSIGTCGIHALCLVFYLGLLQTECPH